jgi:hypothetical protein
VEVLGRNQAETCHSLAELSMVAMLSALLPFFGHPDIVVVANFVAIIFTEVRLFLEPIA